MCKIKHPKLGLSFLGMYSLTTMTKSISTPKYKRFCKLLYKAREDAGFTQAGLAKRLKKPQSFVSKYESGERRLDFVEFLDIATAIGLDIQNFIKALKFDDNDHSNN